jgi:hypothetical protein
MTDADRVRPRMAQGTPRPATPASNRAFGRRRAGLISEVLVELNPAGSSVWRARVDPLMVVVEGDTIVEAEAAALAAIVEAGSEVAGNLMVRVRFGTRAQRVAAGWVPPDPGPAAHQ